MNQVIFLSFNCFKFKKNPKAQLLINDIFIDEFEIEQFISSSFLERIKDNKPYKDYINSKKISIMEGNPSIKVWEIDNSVFHKHKKNRIEVKISNDDNNHTNGLMTISTLIELEDFYILPKKIIDTAVLDRYYFNQKNIKGVDKIPGYYKKRTVFFENLIAYTYFNRNWDNYNFTTRYYIHGGSGSFICTTRTKHGLQKNHVRSGYWKLGLENMKYIMNKYNKTNEN